MVQGPREVVRSSREAAQSAPWQGAEGGCIEPHSVVSQAEVVQGPIWPADRPCVTYPARHTKRLSTPALKDLLS